MFRQWVVGGYPSFYHGSMQNYHESYKGGSLSEMRGHFPP